MGYTLTWKANFYTQVEGGESEELLVSANYLSQEDAERQADAYAEVPGAPAPQYVLDPDDDPVAIYRDVEVFQVVGDGGEVVEEKPAAEDGDQGYLVVTQEKLSGDEFDTAKVALLVELEPEAPAEG